MKYRGTLQRVYVATLVCVAIITMRVGIAQNGDSPESGKSPLAAIATMPKTRPRQDPSYPLHPVNPSFGPQVRANEEEGTCVISAMVDSTGWIRAVQLVVPSERPHIDLACLMAGVGGRMLPATLEGRPVVGWTTFPIQWHLNRSDPRFPTTPIPESVPRIADDAELMVGPRYYPSAAIQKREEGDCVVQLRVNEMGAIDGSRVLRSSGSRDLDQACTNAASHVPFLPAKSDAYAIASETALAMYWRLK
jgi:TonB family protein